MTNHKKISALMIAGVLLAQAAAAEDKPVLTVYTYEGFNAEWGPGPAIEKAFEATCGCEVKYVTAGDAAALLSRVLLEGKDTRADVVLGLDTNLTEDLIAEGFAREVISKLQTMRKEAGFEVVDRIHVTVKTADEKLAQIVAQNAEAIERGVLALDVKLGDAPEGAYVRDWSINGVDATLSVLKA